MKNVRIILLLSVILFFFYFIKINEGFGPNDLLSFITGETEDSTGDSVEEAEEQNIQTLCPTSTTEGTRKNTSLMDICSTHDSVKNLNDNIPELPSATLVYPKDPVSIKNLHFLPEDLDPDNTTISYNEQQISFSNILKDSSQNLQTWWNYNFHDSTETPEIDIKDSDDNEINTNIDLVYLSGCSQIIASDEDSNTPLQCHNNKDMNTCNLQEHCVWDALCEQPYRTEEHSNKIFTPKECILNGGIFRSDLLHYAKNTIVNDEISTSFNMKDITDFWFKTSNSQDAGQNDSDSCSFNPTNLQDSYLSQLTQSSDITDSYLDSSCYLPFFKRIFDESNDIDDNLGLEKDNEKITTKNSGAIFKSDNSYNNPMNLFDFRIDDPNCNWSKRMNTPEQFAQCFKKDIDQNTLPSFSDWSGMTCDKWSTDNSTDNCSTNTGNTRLDSEKIIENSNLSNDTLKEYCCLPDYTCTNIYGVDPNDQDVTQFSCPNRKTILNVNADTCSGEGCSREECCVRNTICSRYKRDNNIECSADTFIKSRITYCFENDNQENLCDNFQDHCCEEHPMCTTHYSSDEDCPGGYYLDTNARCSTPDCSVVYDCCKIKANCSSAQVGSQAGFQCNTGYRLKDGITNCPTNEGSCSNSICCEPEPTCSDMSDSITCPEGKILDGNQIYTSNDSCCIDDEIICANPNGIELEERSVLSFDPSTDTLGDQCNPGFDEDEVWTYTNDIVDLEHRQHIQQMTLDLTSPSSNCGAESVQCPADKPILDTYKPCSGDTCDADNCCKTETYFCKGRDSDVIYQNAGEPPDSISDNDPCLSDTLTNFIWESCSTALSSIDLSSYPYIGNIYQACRVEPPSEQSSVGDANIPTTLDSQPRCSPDICTTGKVLTSNPPPICSSENCTVDECCEDENTCENYYVSNECPAGNKTDGVCNGVCTPEDCCLPSNTINLSLQINDVPSTGTASGSGQSSSLNTILQTYLNKMIIVPDPDPSKVNFTSDDSWNQYNTSSFLNLKYTPTDNISPASSITDPNTDPDSNSIKFYVKGSNDALDISNLVTQEAITRGGSRDILTFIVELNNLHFKSSASNNTPFGNLTVNCGDSNFQSSDIYLYKFLLYKEDNHLKLYTSSEQGQDISSFIESSTSPTGIEYDIGSINGDKITFDINGILTQISSHLSSPTPNTFEQILLKLLALRTDDIHNIFFGDTEATINIPGGYEPSITNGNTNLQDKICSLDLDINKTDSWELEFLNPGFSGGVLLSNIKNQLSTYDFTTLTESTSPPHPSTPGIDNFIKYDNGLIFNTHFDVCDSLTISDPSSLLIRLKELILTGIDIYTLYNGEHTDVNFNKDPIGCGSSTLSDGSVFTPEEIRNINSFLTNDSIFTTDEKTTIDSFISKYGIDISNLQYTSSADTSSADTSSADSHIHYTNGDINIDTIVLTIS